MDTALNKPLVRCQHVFEAFPIGKSTYYTGKNQDGLN